MTWIFAILILASIAAMAWAFLASAKLDAATEELERRVEAQLDLSPVAAASSDKGASK